MCGWFYILYVIVVMVYDMVLFKNVVFNGLVLDKNGQKMLKCLGNVVNLFEILSQYGVDVICWYMMVNSDFWDNFKFDLEGVEEVC